MQTYVLLQHYWWLIISLLGGILVFLLFVQGGQGLLFRVGRTDQGKHLIIATLGSKWSLTFTTLVTFGGAFFASFPLFYSTSFGGAFYVWMAILFFFVIQAVGYEFYKKPHNFLGDRTYEIFLFLNGICGTLLLGTAVGTLFFGAHFSISRESITLLGGDMAISRWTTPWRGLEAVADPRNLLMGLLVVFLSRTLALQYFLNAISDTHIEKESRRRLPWNAGIFVVLFLSFMAALLTAKGFSVDPVSGTVAAEPYKYLHNVLQMPFVSGVFLLALLSVLFGIGLDLFGGKSKGIWFSGVGTMLTVCCLFLFAGWNNTCYYASLSDMQSSLSIYNSSSSPVTLEAMAYVSLLIPFVMGYIFYAWRQMNKKKIDVSELEQSH